MLIIISVVFLAGSIWAILPFSFPMGLNWGAAVLEVLKGGVPIVGIMTGLIAFLIGIADLKDRAAAKKVKEKASN